MKDRMARDRNSGASSASKAATEGVRRMRRPERREQILAAATQAFSQGGFAATSLGDIAEAAGVSQAILYRHFDSKSDLYRAVLDRATRRLIEVVGADRFTQESIPALVRAAADDPYGFRLLFRYAVREAEFRDQMDRFSADVVTVTYRHLADLVPEPAWAQWAAQLVPTVAIEAVLAWLDVGAPDPDIAAERVHRAVDGIIMVVVPEAT